MRSTTISSSDFNFRPRTALDLPALETPGFDFLVPVAVNFPDAMASGKFSAAISGTSSQVMSVLVSDPVFPSQPSPERLTSADEEVLDGLALRDLVLIESKDMSHETSST